MKLTELDPKWITRDGVRVGVIFRCPCSKCGGKPPNWLTCYSVPAGKYAEQGALVRELVPAEELHEVTPCRGDIAWQFSGDTFETLTIAPSLDASASGHWHGYIRGGEAVTA